MNPRTFFAVFLKSSRKMERYNLLIKKSAVKELKQVPSKQLKRLIARILALEHNPRPQGAEKLAASEYYRIRQGDFRIVYGIDDGEMMIEIIKIGHRREVYR
jgi:mRNA interferase RelE/StbE